jgi:hypothetical protein
MCLLVTGHPLYFLQHLLGQLFGSHIVLFVLCHYFAAFTYVSIARRTTSANEALSRLVAILINAKPLFLLA